MNASNLNIVLFEPGIALNTGNIGRTCAATGSALHLIRPFGFRLNEKEIKRAGMDYWERIEVHDYINYWDFLERNPEARIFYATTKRTGCIPKPGLHRVTTSCSVMSPGGSGRRSLRKMKTCASGYRCCRMNGA